MAWAASFEGLNCHDQNSSMEQTIDHEMAHSNNNEEHCCDCNILVLPNLHIKNNVQEPDTYFLTIFTNIRSRYYQPPVPPPTV